MVRCAPGLDSGVPMLLGGGLYFCTTAARAAAPLIMGAFLPLIPSPSRPCKTADTAQPTGHEKQNSSRLQDPAL